MMIKPQYLQLIAALHDQPTLVRIDASTRSPAVFLDVHCRPPTVVFHAKLRHLPMTSNSSTSSSMSSVEQNFSDFVHFGLTRKTGAMAAQHDSCGRFEYVVTEARTQTPSTDQCRSVAKDRECDCPLPNNAGIDVLVVKATISSMQTALEAAAFLKEVYHALIKAYPTQRRAVSLSYRQMAQFLVGQRLDLARLDDWLLSPVLDSA